jgi:hypothetical protein
MNETRSQPLLGLIRSDEANGFSAVHDWHLKIHLDRYQHHTLQRQTANTDKHKSHRVGIQDSLLECLDGESTIYRAEMIMFTTATEHA